MHMDAQTSPGRDWTDRLAEFVGTRLTVVGIGRPDAGDDGVGGLLINLLAGRTSASLFDAETTPENFIGPITRTAPDVIVLVDALHFDGPVGEVRLLEPDQLANTDFTTHALSPQILLDFLTERTGARCLVLGVQPGRSGLNTPMSPPVADAARHIADVLSRLFPV